MNLQNPIRIAREKPNTTAMLPFETPRTKDLGRRYRVTCTPIAALVNTPSGAGAPVFMIPPGAPRPSRAPETPRGETSRVLAGALSARAQQCAHSPREKESLSSLQKENRKSEDVEAEEALGELDRATPHLEVQRRARRNDGAHRVARSGKTGLAEGQLRRDHGASNAADLLKKTDGIEFQKIPAAWFLCLFRN